MGNIRKITFLADLDFFKGILTKVRLNKTLYPAIERFVVINTVVITTITCQALFPCDVKPSTFNSAEYFFYTTAI